jgi:hypothetical protein
VFFDRAGTYQASLYGKTADARELAQLQMTLALSRYVGVSRWYSGENVLADIVWDTTDRIREGSTVLSILGLVAYDQRVAELVRALGTLLSAPAA